ncbi:hypothetical protein EJB05_42233, partial [Eragrostis curvula]
LLNPSSGDLGTAALPERRSLKRRATAPIVSNDASCARSTGASCDNTMAKRFVAASSISILRTGAVNCSPRRFLRCPLLDGHTDSKIMYGQAPGNEIAGVAARACSGAWQPSWIQQPRRSHEDKLIGVSNTGMFSDKVVFKSSPLIPTNFGLHKYSDTMDKHFQSTTCDFYG